MACTCPNENNCTCPNRLLDLVDVQRSTASIDGYFLRCVRTGDGGSGDPIFVGSQINAVDIGDLNGALIAFLNTTDFAYGLFPVLAIIDGDAYPGSALIGGHFDGSVRNYPTNKIVDFYDTDAGESVLYVTAGGILTAREIPIVDRRDRISRRDGLKHPLRRDD
jgi:hypothetical protein